MQSAVSERNDLSKQADVVRGESDTPERKVLQVEDDSDIQQQDEIKKCQRDAKIPHKTNFDFLVLNLQHEEIQAHLPKHDQKQHAARLQGPAELGLLVPTGAVLTEQSSHPPNEQISGFKERVTLYPTSFNPPIKMYLHKNRYLHPKC